MLAERRSYWRRKIVGVTATLAFLLAFFLTARRREYFPVRKVSDKSGNGDCTVVYDNHGDPIWMQCDQNGVGKPDTYIFCFRGKDAMIICLDKNDKITQSEVTYYDEAGRPTIMWVDRNGTGDFTDRVRYTKDKALKEVWCGEAWRTIERRAGRQGVIVGERWHPVAFTNGAWRIQQEQDAAAQASGG
jgi:hypothetical protein